MASPPDIDEAPEAWDELRLGPKLALAPGVVVDVKVMRSQKLDVKSRPGANGASIVAQGYEPAKVSIEMQMWWTAHQRERIAQLIEALVPKLQKTRPEAYLVGHPLLALHKISAVVVEGIDGPGMPQNGISTYTLNCVEYFPAPKAAASTTKKITSLSSVGTYVPVDDTPHGPPPRPSATVPKP